MDVRLAVKPLAFRQIVIGGPQGRPEVRKGDQRDPVGRNLPGGTVRVVIEGRDVGAAIETAHGHARKHPRAYPRQAYQR
jgi:hypothetical protein